jgi:hypothetical protein
MEAQNRMSADKKRGVPINEEYFSKRPSIAKTFIRPKHSEEIAEIYNFIIENSIYAETRIIGFSSMAGTELREVPVAPKIDIWRENAKIIDIDIDRYKDHCFLFIRKQSEREQRKE